MNYLSRKQVDKALDKHLPDAEAVWKYWSKSGDWLQVKVHWRYANSNRQVDYNIRLPV